MLEVIILHLICTLIEEFQCSRKIIKLKPPSPIKEASFILYIFGESGHVVVLQFNRSRKEEEDIGFMSSKKCKTWLCIYQPQSLRKI